MNPDDRVALDESIAEHCRREQWAAAATAAVKGYGPDILGYLFALTRHEQDTADVFSDFCADLWRGLPGYRGEAQLRTWLYRLAYHAHARAARKAIRDKDRVRPFAEIPELEDLVDHVRTRTLPHLRTEVKAEVMRLRAQLDDEEQTLLILRVDRRLEWDEIARIVAEPSSTAEAKRSAATLRKRFERLKAKLRELSAGLSLDE
ncbi:MAG TPA: sigma-70 family RNA polymerase sigma factor [Nannocystaceae bacterium]|nr:sigma-70 family RNA polymerase sigma factor [Nannocystaceae bacterium]